MVLTFARHVRSVACVPYHGVDALILATARLAGCRVVCSEGLSAGQDYDGVRVENPPRARRIACGTA
jgi:predicted nucleic acid-binding protein